jgi:hypothetical protein
MRINYISSHRLIAYGLFISIFLQSCGGFSSQVIPQEFVTSGSYLASFYQEEGELKVDLRADAKQPEPNYKSIPVMVEQCICLDELIQLDPLTQQQRIQLKRKKGKVAQVIVYNGGLAGGMKRGVSNQNFGNQAEEKGKEKDEENPQREKSSNKRSRLEKEKGLLLTPPGPISEHLQLILPGEEPSIVIRLLEAIKKEDSESLQNLCEKYIGSTEPFSLPDSILSPLLKALTTHGSSKEYQEYFGFLAKHIQIPSSLLKIMQRDLIELGKTLGKTEQDKKKSVDSFRKKIKTIQVYQHAVSIPTKELNSTKKFTCKFSTSTDRAEKIYSDSEDEGAPHFNKVYNFTKSIDGFIDNYALPDTNLLPEELQEDAKAIRKTRSTPDEANLPIANELTILHPIHSIGLPEDNLTILCVALRQHDGRIKKFVFTNWEGEPPHAIIEAAHDKKYHVVVAQRSHAEGEFLQFLQERPNRYTHIVSMACDKEHCESCTKMFEKWLKPEVFNKINISGTNIKYDDWRIPQALEEFLKCHQCMPDDLSKKNQASNQQYRQQNIHTHRKLETDEWEKRSWKRGKN